MFDNITTPRRNRKIAYMKRQNSTNHIAKYVTCLRHASDTPPVSQCAHIVKRQHAGADDLSEKAVMASLKEICAGLPVDPLPSPRDRDDSVPHAPVRTVNLTDDERRVWKIVKSCINCDSCNAILRISDPGFLLPPWLQKRIFLTLIQS